MVTPGLLDDAVFEGGPRSVRPDPIDAQRNEAKAAVRAAPTGSALNEAVTAQGAQPSVGGRGGSVIEVTQNEHGSWAFGPPGGE